MARTRVTARHSIAVALIGAGVGALVLSSPAGAAGAAGPTPVVTDRETIQVEMSPTGKVDVARLFSQLTVSGDGSYVISDPTSAKAWRNLDGFAKPRFDGGNAVWNIDVRGKTSRRSVSEVSSSTLPVTINASYTLNGRAMKPKDLVGKSGTLGVTWVVENVTSTPTVINFKDGHGAPVSKTVDLVTPYVGQLATILPSSFRNIVAERADLAGDGHGGTQALWTMVLFEPIGQVTQTFGYTAEVTKMKLPAATVQVVPVPPKRKPELKFGEDGFAEGAHTGAELTEGATEIDANLIKLRDGAGELLSGLGQLADGASQLQDGLAGKAAPGAKELAAGAGLVAAGAPTLVSGLGQISGGLAALNSATTGLPAAKAGVIALQAGVAALQAGVATAVAGIGGAATSGTLLNGMAQISGGLGQLASSSTGLPAAKGGVDAVKSGLATAKTSLQGLQAAVGGSVAEIQGAYASLGCTPVLNVVCGLLDSALNSSHGLASVTLPGLGALETGTGTAIAGLGQVSTGLGSAIAGVGLLQGGSSLVTAGLNQLKVGLKSNSSSSPGITEGLAAVSAGLGQLVAGLTAAVDGVGLLAPGAAKAHAGSQTLADGAEAVADGASELSDGIGDAADGSGELADGLTKAKDGGAQIADGTGRLQSEGTSKLVTAGEETTMSFGEKLARMQALDEKAAEGALPFGAPEGATGSAAYSFELAAQTTEGRDAAVRTVLAVALLVLTGLLATVLRRRVAAR